MSDSGHLPPPPASWSPARRVARAVSAPVERFLAVEASSGMLLLAVALIALVWANSPWSGAYEALWSTPLGFSAGGLSFVRDLRWWVNDGLMTVFFFVVGLEIRREVYQGELSELRRAALPVAAAIGGMILPALIYTALNLGRPSMTGWAVPVATDIAFAVGVLALLGNRVPPALRVLLLALAVVDDVGAILVIALFYAHGVNVVGLAVAALGILAIRGMQGFGVRSALAYVAPAIVVWAGAYAGGVHPSLAGVVVGVLTPAVAWWGPQRFAVTAEQAGRDVGLALDGDGLDIHVHLDLVRTAVDEAVSPVERLERALHGWVAYGIMPLFALANAGVALGSAQLSGDGWRVFLGIAVGLVVGKPIGVIVASRLATATGAAVAPRGVSWSQVSVVGLVAGIGFTMALFVAQLAFPPGPLLETAKLAILTGSGMAGIVGYLVGRVRLQGGVGDGGARSAAEAEASTEV